MGIVSGWWGAAGRVSHSGKPTKVVFVSEENSRTNRGWQLAKCKFQRNSMTIPRLSHSLRNVLIKTTTFFRPSSILLLPQNSIRNQITHQIVENFQTRTRLHRSQAPHAFATQNRKKGKKIENYLFSTQHQHTVLVRWRRPRGKSHSQTENAHRRRNENLVKAIVKHFMRVSQWDNKIKEIFQFETIPNDNNVVSLANLVIGVVVRTVITPDRLQILTKFQFFHCCHHHL